FIVTEGTCEVSRVVGNRTETLRVIGPGGVVGEIGLFTGSTRVANVRATTDVRVLVVTRDALERELGRASWMRAFVEAAIGRVAGGARGGGGEGEGRRRRGRHRAVRRARRSPPPWGEDGLRRRPSGADRSAGRRVRGASRPGATPATRTRACPTARIARRRPRASRSLRRGARRRPGPRPAGR